MLNRKIFKEDEMKIDSLLFQLKEAARVSEEDMEHGHLLADKALIEYINNPKVEEAYDEVVKHYA